MPAEFLWFLLVESYSFCSENKYYNGKFCLNGVRKEKKFLLWCSLNNISQNGVMLLSYFNFGLDSLKLIVNQKNSRSK